MQFLPFLFGQSAAVSGIIVLGRKLVAELLQPILLSGAVDVGDLVFRDAGKVEVDLKQYHYRSSKMYFKKPKVLGT